jgi:hypothetical protein
MNHIEAMKLALDAPSLRHHTGNILDADKCIIHRSHLRAAIEQAEGQEPVAEVAGRPDALHIKFLPAGSRLGLGDKLYSTTPAQPALKPFFDPYAGETGYLGSAAKAQASEPAPKREWVGLTPNDVTTLLYLECGATRQRTATEMAFAVESKLKELNHG